MFSYCWSWVWYCSICLSVCATDSMAVMTFCTRFPPSMTGMPACAGDMVVIDPAIRVTARATLAAKNFCFICFLLALVVKRLVRLRERHVLGHDDVEPIAGADFQGRGNVQILGNELGDGVAQHLPKCFAQSIAGALLIAGGTAVVLAH